MSERYGKDFDPIKTSIYERWGWLSNRKIRLKLPRRLKLTEAQMLFGSYKKATSSFFGY